MNRIDRVKLALQALSPKYLEVRDETRLHKGHREATDGHHTHLRITISDVFIGKTLLEKHREVKNLIQDEFKTGLHAVSIRFKQSS